MSRKVICSAINDCLGFYINEIGDSDVTSSLLDGDLILRNISLSKTFLDTLDQSVALSRVSIKFLHIQIPWIELSNMYFLIEIQGVDVVLKEGKSVKNPKVGKIEEITAEEEMDDTYLNKLLSLLINKLKVTISDVHIRYEYPSSSMKAIGAHVEQIQLDTIKSDIPSSNANKSFSLQSLSIYVDPNKRSSPGMPSTGVSLLLQDFSLRSDIHWNASSVEDRWISAECLQDKVKSSVPSVDQSVLLEYLDKKDCPLLSSSASYHSAEEMREKIRNDMQGKLSDESTAEIVSASLFEPIKTPPPRLELGVRMSDTKISIHQSDLADSIDSIIQTRSEQATEAFGKEVH
ncbi:uncharacterized protein [Blastocystis hominis]|uniref:Chorein N-terminal domain-containing protein n=1 Tax=Blastocystis hominis TaxID=12968 RepID=D8M9M9_BLAHO|nr:uncharacterized protein [Blastocystis hominis]CBK24768.2 unnamed protein product [Blastocystis hominis]|eukprot:XP_012898816.1 uncharacterized protein [Blastocystis hominis]